MLSMPILSYQALPLFLPGEKSWLQDPDFVCIPDSYLVHNITVMLVIVAVTNHIMLYP